MAKGLNFCDKICIVYAPLINPSCTKAVEECERSHSSPLRQGHSYQHSGLLFNEGVGGINHDIQVTMSQARDTNTNARVV